MNENLQIREELLSLYKSIKNDIPNHKLLTTRTKNIDNSNEIDSLALISCIKDSISLIINNKISQDISINNNKNNNDNKSNIKNESYNNNPSYISKEYLQLENQLIKLENDNKYYIQNYFIYKIQKDVLEMKLNAYMSLEEEYEELKEKVKYEGGKFLDNDRKDNEIIILRSENSALKKEIIKLENINKETENKNNEYQKIIKNLEKNIDILKNKINNLENIIREKSLKNISLVRDKNNSCSDLGIKHYENTFDKLENNYKFLINDNNHRIIKNLKANYPQSFKFKNKRNINFNTPKNDYLNLEKNKNFQNNKNNNTINANAFSSTFSKINKFSNKNIIINGKNEFNNFKKIRNNSINIIKIERDESKSLSKNKKERNNKENVLYKNKNKIKTFNQIFNSKLKNNSPISFQNSKNSGKIVHKYIQKEVHKNMINNFTHNIRSNSNKN